MAERKNEVVERKEEEEEVGKIDKKYLRSFKYPSSILNISKDSFDLNKTLKFMVKE